MNQLISGLLLFIFIPLALFCQSGIGSTVLLKGKVINLQNGSPIETKFYLIGSDGKKVPVKTSTDGSYSIPLSQSGSYFVASEQWLCVEPVNFDIKVLPNYYEKEINLFFVPFEPGLLIRKAFAFEEHSAELTEEGKASLKQLANLSKNNPKLSFSIVIRTNKSIFKKVTKTVTEGKKKKKVVVTPEEQAYELSRKRAESVRNFLSENKMPERNYSFKFETYSSSGGQQSKTRKTKVKNPKVAPSEFNLQILIDKILKFDLKER